MTVRNWRRLAAGMVGIVVLGAGFAGGGSANAADTTASSGSARAGWRDARLAAQLLTAVNDRQFATVLDTIPPSSTAAKTLDATSADAQNAARGKAMTAAAVAAAATIHQTPNVDTTVIELDGAGRPLAAGTVLLSPQYPQGKVVKLDANLATDQVRWRQWDDATWDNNGGQGTVDVLPGRENAPIDFMSPYPASVLKLMAGFGILQLIDRGELSLDDTYAYAPVGTPSSLCGPAKTATVGQFFDLMITVSSNPSACALIKLLHDRGAIDGLNQTFADLGMPTLRLVGTNPNTGGTWGNPVTMNSIDTAKLLLLLNGGSGTLWKSPAGTPVTKAVLSDSSRQYFLNELGENGLNQVLSTTNWCGRAYPTQGIPQVSPKRWWNRTDGTMTVDGRYYGQDVRPCDATAQVTFAHKTGLADTSGNDAGIVHSLAGKPSRNYIVVVHSNLGYRYIDVNRPADPAGVYPVQYTEKFAQLGKAIDTAVTGHHNP
jgi:hypothetical protein